MIFQAHLLSSIHQKNAFRTSPLRHSFHTPSIYLPSLCTCCLHHSPEDAPGMCLLFLSLHLPLAELSSLFLFFCWCSGLNTVLMKKHRSVATTWVLSMAFSWTTNCLTWQLINARACSVVSNSLWFHGLYPARLFCRCDSPRKNTGVGCHFLLQGNLPDPGIKSVSPSPVSPALTGGFFTALPPGKQYMFDVYLILEGRGNTQGQWNISYTHSFGKL